MSNSLQLSNDDIFRATLSTAGLGRNIEDMDATTEADLRAIVRSGLRRFLFPTVGEFPYRWRWLERFFSISVVSTYDTGTLTIAAGTITLAGGTWPTWAADGFLSVDGQIVFIDTRVDTDTATTEHTELAVSAGATFTLYRYRYPLPTDFGEFVGGVTYSNGTDNWILAGAAEAELRLRYAINYNYNNRTSHYAITFTPAGEANITLWPVPAPDTFIRSVYSSVPEDNLPDDLRVASVDPVIQCAPAFAEAAVEAVLAAAEAYNNDAEGVHEKRFQIALATGIAHDKAASDGYDFSHNLNRRQTRGPWPTSIDFSGQL